MKITCPHCKKEINKNNIGNYSDTIVYGMNCMFCKKYFVYYTKIELEPMEFKTDSELQESWEIYIKRYKGNK